MYKAPRNFYIVSSEQDSRFVRHEGGDIAEKEARRLAQSNPGTTFYVVKTVRAYRYVVPPSPQFMEVWDVASPSNPATCIQETLKERTTL